MKRPYFPLYAGDWLGDPDIQSRSLAAKGLLIQLRAYMCNCETYGVLTSAGEVIHEDNLLLMTGVSKTEFERLLNELVRAKILLRNERGALYDPKMVRDEEIRIKRSSGGALGGNPRLKRMDKHMPVSQKQSNLNGYPSLEDEIDNESESSPKEGGVGETGKAEVTWPKEIDTPECRAAWALWESYRKERGLARYKPIGLRQQLKRLSAFPPDTLVRLIEYSIAQNYQGIIDDPRRVMPVNGHAHATSSPRPTGLLLRDIETQMTNAEHELELTRYGEMDEQAEKARLERRAKIKAHMEGLRKQKADLAVGGGL